MRCLVLQLTWGRCWSEGSECARSKQVELQAAATTHQQSAAPTSWVSPAQFPCLAAQGPCSGAGSHQCCHASPAGLWEGGRVLRSSSSSFCARLVCVQARPTRGSDLHRMLCSPLLNELQMAVCWQKVCLLLMCCASWLIAVVPCNQHSCMMPCTTSARGSKLKITPAEEARQAEYSALRRCGSTSVRGCAAQKAAQRAAGTHERQGAQPGLRAC